MIQDNFLRSLAEPTHVRLFHYLEIMIVSMPFLKYYQPSTPAGYISVPVVLIVLTIVRNSLVYRMVPWLPFSYRGAGRHQAMYREHLLSMKALEDPKGEPGFPDGEVVLLKGMMSRMGLAMYIGALGFCIACTFFMWWNNFPAFPLVILMAISLDLCWSIALYCTRLLDVFCCVYVDQEGVRISKGVFSRERYLGFDEFTIIPSYIMYGLVRVVMCAGKSRYTFIAGPESYKALQHFIDLKVVCLADSDCEDDVT